MKPPDGEDAAWPLKLATLIYTNEAPMPLLLRLPLAFYLMQRQAKDEHLTQQHAAGLHEVVQDAGETPPAIRISCLNTGLTNKHVTWPNPYAYTFTEALEFDLTEIFTDQKCHGLFLCEMGSQKPDQNIDTVFKQRKNNMSIPKMSIVDTSGTLKEYLLALLKKCNLKHLQVHSQPPYAYIGDPNILSVEPPKYFYPLPEDIERRGVHCEMVFKPTGDNISVVCNHSPSSPNWKNLTTPRKHIIFNTCMQQAGVGSVNTTGKWILCGDLNTTMGSLMTWKKDFETIESMILIHRAHLGVGNRPGDYMLSSGFATVHVKSNIGCSNKNRKHASDSHDMVTLYGVPRPGSDAPPLAVNSAVQTNAASTQAVRSSVSQEPMLCPSAPAASPAQCHRQQCLRQLHPLQGMRQRHPLQCLRYLRQLIHL